MYSQKKIQLIFQKFNQNKNNFLQLKIIILIVINQNFNSNRIMNKKL